MSEKEAQWLDFLQRSKNIPIFPREMLRKRMNVSSINEFKSLVRGYNGMTDLYTSLYSDFQIKNDIYDCVFIDVDCYVEVGETVEDLNRFTRIIEDFLLDRRLLYRRFFSGKKGVHYYIPFPAYHFRYFSNAVRRWASMIPKVERVDMQHYWFTGEIKKNKVPIYDVRAIGRPRQLVRIPYTKHPRSGLECVECYGKIELPIKKRRELWHPDINESLLESLKMRDKEPEQVDRSGEIDFDLADSPACIIKAVRLLPAHLTHDQAWHLTNYMVTLGATDEEIEEFFKLDPRYDGYVSRTQIESVRRGNLSNMSCKRISSIGLCDEEARLKCPMHPSIDRYLFFPNGTKSNS